jgi:TspO/MBR family
MQTMPTPSGSDAAHRSPRTDGITLLAARALSAGAVALTALAAKRYSPTPDHPAIERWYRRLEKPGFKPPHPAIGVAETLLAVAAPGLFTSPRGMEGVAAGKLREWRQVR